MKRVQACIYKDLTCIYKEIYNKLPYKSIIKCFCKKASAKQSESVSETFKYLAKYRLHLYEATFLAILL